MSTAVLFDKYYYSRPAFVDGTTGFHRLCRKWIPANGRILELGPGPANSTSSFLSGLGRLTGVDISAEGRTNPALEQFQLFDGGKLPFGDASFDACVSNYVLEHVAAPHDHFEEVGRVLRPGGVYCFRTPNLWHYVTLASRFLPHRFHLQFANRLRSLGDGAHEPYPTVYRANSRRAVVRQARGAGLREVRFRYVEAEPLYGACHPALFYPMMIYERAVNSTALLAPLRMNIVAVLRKEEE